MKDPAIQIRLRSLPAVNSLVDQIVAWEAKFGAIGCRDEDRVDICRRSLEAIRQRILQGEEIDVPVWLEEARHAIVKELQIRPLHQLNEVINATGIILHTNLGRAPIDSQLLHEATRKAGQYCNLEVDLESGVRSQRQKPIREFLQQLTGCESATVVNNCAAATILVLRALASSREVIVSRGQLVEIGGSFRIPEIMEVSGAKLREVGTTNITRIKDFEKAIQPQTALLMRIHQSNFRIRGFTESPSLEELVELGHKHNLPVVDDVGSGVLIPLTPFGMNDEPLVPRSIQAGADLVLFSGDKLLGGPQCGIIIGKKSLIEKLEKDPLMRALRCDKITLSLLQGTLQKYLQAKDSWPDILLYRLLAISIEELRVRSAKFIAELSSLEEQAEFQLAEETAYVGGGTLPDQALPTIVIQVSPKSISSEILCKRLREKFVLARISEDRVLLDLRTVLNDQKLAGVLKEALEGICYPDHFAASAR
ncbi:L-seryl-tRNA(Sec) selenium transferase [Telmatocola sphagniphila]|uniref:L-seryl-tRNA(Sec) selenium transferase n=1 Tax=Telmatocola sphagniphila TaxID=1123043 RepID=A0A8E6B7V8_9BACT|nr:L-seryl-tRNA(Sec) selenium transferase [Telmatocola sphagniphila]QVL32972.1 L-seryl-tRNA(Sec) selenium transferase [Telmatocola sphagniphila]